MATRKKIARKRIQALKKAHHKRAALVLKVDRARKQLESAQAKFEKRSRKLQAVEARIADLSAAVYGTAEASNPPPPTGHVDAAAASQPAEGV